MLVCAMCISLQHAISDIVSSLCRNVTGCCALLYEIRKLVQCMRGASPGPSINRGPTTLDDQGYSGFWLSWLCGSRAVWQSADYTARRHLQPRSNASPTGIGQRSHPDTISICASGSIRPVQCDSAPGGYQGHHGEFRGV